MSHFTVLVIGENVEEQLAPYQENNMGNCPEEYIKFSDETEEVKEKWNELSQEDKEFYKDISNFAKEYYGYEEENGKFGYYDNPNTRWDWYQIGGRWAGKLKLKEGKKGILKEPICLGIYKEGDKQKKKEHDRLLNENRVDSARKGDIDFPPDEEAVKKAKRFWEIYVEGKKPKNKEEKEIVDSEFYKKEYYLKTYKTKENYAKLSNDFHTFAVLKEGKWHEKGRMGYFGCSDETPDEGEFWERDYFNKFIKDLPDDTLLTIVDCHI